MIRTVTLGILSFFVSTAIAQPVLQSTDIGNASLQLGLIFGATNAFPDGANQTWNLTSTPITVLGTAVYGTASGTPYAAQYPTSTRAVTSTVTGLGTYYTYWRTSSTALELTGDGIGSGQDDVYLNAQQLLQFPFAYGTSFTDTYQIDGLSQESVTWTYGGYGTLITSNGTFTNVVKVHNDFSDRMIFWNKSPLYPILDIDFEGDGTAWVPSGGVGMDESGDVPAIAAYPNPTTDLVYVNGAVAGDQYTVLDPLGRTVIAQRTGSVTGQFPLDLSGLASGSYMLRLVREGSVAVLPIVKQ